MKYSKRGIVIIIILAFALAFVTGCNTSGKYVDVEPVPAQLVLSAPQPLRTYAAAAGQSDPLNVSDGVYTFAWLSDTQHYSDQNPYIFRLMTSYISREQERQNIVYAIHTGDLVHHSAYGREWEAASSAMELMTVPYGVCAGNHDVAYSSADYSSFSEYFGTARFSDMPCYGGSYEDNRGHYDLITAGNTDYIFVYMGYGVTDDGISWARRALDKYPERVGVLCTHDYFKTDMSLSDAGGQLLDGVVKKCGNVYMVLCGHRYNIGNSVTDVNGRTVLQIMGNYQAAGSFGGGGYMRLIQIDEARSQLRIYSYSPLYDDYRYYDTPGAETEKYAADPEYEYVEMALPWA